MKPTLVVAAGIAATAAAYLFYHKKLRGASRLASRLSSQVYDSKAAMGEAAASYVAKKIADAIAAQIVLV